MTDREKLIALIRDCAKFHEEVKEKWILGGKQGERPNLIASIADHLLANGVVVREKGEWQYTDDIDEDGNIQAYCSACGAGDKHATSMVGKVPYCWKCGADMRGEQ